jgi:hypothetical protein
MSPHQILALFNQQHLLYATIHRPLEAGRRSSMERAAPEVSEAIGRRDSRGRHAPCRLD